MAENSKIEWTHHTFNPVIGCQKVGPGCDHCYAEAMMDTRLGRVEWGPKGERRVTSDAYWRQPIKWNREAEAVGERRRVFCASLADVFDSAWPEGVRDRLWALIRATPHLDWMLLTKRPGNIAKMLPPDWGSGYANVWIGCTVVNQAEADRDIPKLLAMPAKVRFLSMEPLLGPVDLRAYMPGCYECGGGCGTRLAFHPATDRCVPCQEDYGKDSGALEFCPSCGASEWEPVCPDCNHYMVQHHPDTPNLDWVITGGESGPGARPMHPDWPRDIRDQCVAAEVPFFFKQWGEWVSALQIEGVTGISAALAATGHWAHPHRYRIHGGALDGNCYESLPAHHQIMRVGKKAAGRLLDGRTWDQMPGVTHG